VNNREKVKVVLYFYQISQQILSAFRITHEAHDVLFYLFLLIGKQQRQIQHAFHA